jgi:hypothetical protein
MRTSWTKRLATARRRHFTHSLALVPAGWRGHGLQIEQSPELGQRLSYVSPTSEKVIETLPAIPQPRCETVIDAWTRSAAEKAGKYRACLCVNCANAEQAKRTSELVRTILPDYREIERGSIRIAINVVI